MNKELRIQVLELPTIEKLDLIMDAWDSIKERALPPPTQDTLDEIDRRIDEHRRDPQAAIPAEVVLKELRARFG